MSGKDVRADPSSDGSEMTAEWLHQHEPGGPFMSLRERVRYLRDERA
jgi:hypothetical protein